MLTVSARLSRCPESRDGRSKHSSPSAWHAMFVPRRISEAYMYRFWSRATASSQPESVPARRLYMIHLEILVPLTGVHVRAATHSWLACCSSQAMIQDGFQDSKPAPFESRDGNWGPNAVCALSSARYLIPSVEELPRETLARPGLPLVGLLEWRARLCQAHSYHSPRYLAKVHEQDSWFGFCHC